MNRLFGLPIEIIDIIYDFAAPFKELKIKNLNELNKLLTIKELDRTLLWLRERMLKSKIKLKNVIESNGHFNRSYSSEAFSNIYDENELKKYFNYLKKCRCCKMHRTNTPKTILSIWDEQPIWTCRNEMSEECLCVCKCRHYKRILVTSFEKLKLRGFHRFSVRRWPGSDA